MSSFSNKVLPEVDYAIKISIAQDWINQLKKDVTYLRNCLQEEKEKQGLNKDICKVSCNNCRKEIIICKDTCYNCIEGIHCYFCCSSCRESYLEPMLSDPNKRLVFKRWQDDINENT